MHFSWWVFWTYKLTKHYIGGAPSGTKAQLGFSLASCHPSDLDPWVQVQSVLASTVRYGTAQAVQCTHTSSSMNVT